MATTPETCAHLASLDGRTPMSLMAVARNLRDAGIFDHVGLGRGATHLSPEDAAALVMASLWTDSATGAPRAAQIVGGLKRKPAPPILGVPPRLAALVNLPTLGETVAAIIEASRELRAELDSFHIDLPVERPVPAATLALTDWLGRRTVVASWTVCADALVAGFYRREMNEAVDRRHSTSVTGATLLSLGDLIRGERAEAAHA